MGRCESVCREDNSTSISRWPMIGPMIQCLRILESLVLVLEEYIIVQTTQEMPVMYILLNSQNALNFIVGTSIAKYWGNLVLLLSCSALHNALVPIRGRRFMPDVVLRHCVGMYCTAYITVYFVVFVVQPLNWLRVARHLFRRLCSYLVTWLVLVWLCISATRWVYCPHTHQTGSHLRKQRR